MKYKLTNIPYHSNLFQYDKGEYRLSGMPGNEGDVVISHGALVYEEHRGQGEGSKLHKVRLRKIKQLGYSYTICTVNSDNIPQIKILENNSWIRLSKFISKCSNHKIYLYGKKI